MPGEWNLYVPSTFFSVLAVGSLGAVVGFVPPTPMPPPSRTGFMMGRVAMRRGSFRVRVECSRGMTREARRVRKVGVLFL